MKIDIKKATKKDLRILAPIYAEEFSKEPYNEPWTNEKAIKKLEVFSKYCDIWGILSNKKTVGLIVINPNQWCPGEVIFGEEIAIKKEFQNKGIGRKTFELIFKNYKNKGFKKFMSIENQNSKAKNLYNRLGILPSKENRIIEKDITK